MRIGIIGSGAIGEAIIRAIIEKGVCKKNEVITSDIAPERREFVQKTFSVETVLDNQKVINKSDVLFIAVKPQSLNLVMNEMQDKIIKGQLLISVVGGAKLETLIKGFHHNFVVRAMPNTPARIGEGITVWTSTKETAAYHETVRTILSTFGDELFVEDEQYIDMATAVSGSGPAYVFLFIESFMDAAVHIGLSREVARKLVYKTVAGSVNLLDRTGIHPAELRNMVTSPGGTTAEALLQLEKGGMKALITEAVIAAYQKAQRLL